MNKLAPTTFNVTRDLAERLAGHLDMPLTSIVTHEDGSMRVGPFEIRKKSETVTTDQGRTATYDRPVISIALNKIPEGFAAKIAECFREYSKYV